ncbi:tubulin-tyrosine ligase family protein [Stylonychia lemnae]|uniref:Tubulin-tyrosine ligase family protein n=1 Tax=Stylonychia lemnae TaxID=5949 RepID=A0A078A881_STYLE|nr:tubulin-tyrosine ligase family protein [Stylonychia lemnae]|eukprot:CDW77787.1 tubulin-tyrosine ligase family protein [Stylonychia lemnae]
MPGNNSQLVRKVILATERSQYWQEHPNITQGHFQFRWAPRDIMKFIKSMSSLKIWKITQRQTWKNQCTAQNSSIYNGGIQDKFDSEITDPIQLASYQNRIQQNLVTFISKTKDVYKQGTYFNFQSLDSYSSNHQLHKDQNCHKNLIIFCHYVILKAKMYGFLSQQVQIEEKEFIGPLLKHNSFIIQKYIEDPFLINKRKFDIRVWVLITQEQEVYFFRRYITDNKLECDFDQDILPKMKYYAALSIESAKRKLNSSKRRQCFEIFGYDYIIDKDFNVWLIEANTNPCIEESSSILKVLIPRMLNDALKLTIDQVFPTLNKNLDDQVTSNGLELRTESLKQKIVHQSIDMNNLGHIDGINNYDIKNLIQSKKQLKKQQVSNGQIDINRKFETFSVPGYPDQINMWQISMHKTSFIQGEDIFNKVDWQ